MSTSTMSSVSEAPAGWWTILKRALLVAVVAFTVLQIKEFKDAGRFDTSGTSLDGGLIGAGFFLVDLIMSRFRGSRRVSS